MRRFEYTDDKSAKFWEIQQSEADLNIRWGRIGTAGQSQTKNFADGSKASAAMQKLVNEKIAKGYAELDTDATAGAGAAPAPARPTPVAAKPASSKAKAEAVPDALESAATPASPAQPAAGTAAPAARPAPAAPAEAVDQQIERAFETIRIQFADATYPHGDEPLTPAKIRRAYNVSELAAGQVNRLLIEAGLISRWQSTPTEEARQYAQEMGLHAGTESAGAPAAQPPNDTEQAPGGVAPWLARGEPLRLGGLGDNTRLLARATRRHPQPVAIVDAERGWQQVRALIGSVIDPDFAGSEPALRAPFEAAWQSREKQEPGGSPLTDAILLVFCLSRGGRGDSAVDVKCIDYLVARHGLAYVIETLLESMAYAIEEVYVAKGNNMVRLHYRASATSGAGEYDPVSDGQWRLRAHLAAAPQEIYDACAAKVKARMSELAPTCQVALALLFPDLPAMAHEVIGQLCSTGKPVPAVHWLQLNATDPAALAQARKVKSDHYYGFWSHTDMVSTVLLEHRLNAVRWLAPGAAEEAAGDALTRIGTPEAIDALARAASSSKPALTRYALAVDRWPVAAAAALARLLNGNSKDQGLLLPTLLDLLRNQPSLPSDLRPWLEPGPNALLETLSARLAGPVDVASDEELPEVLANPPWLGVKKKSAQALQLAPLPLAPIVQWEDGEREEILKLSGWQKGRYREAQRSPDAMAQELGFEHERHSARQDPRYIAARDAVAQGDAAGLLAAWRALLAAKRKDDRYLSFDGVAAAHLPPELGIPLWNVAATEVPCHGVGFVAATWGMPALPGVVARICSVPSEHLGLALRFGIVDIAPVAARAFAKRKTLRAAGREWLKRYPEHAACALIAPALGKPSEARDCAAAALRFLAASGHAALLDEVAARYGQPAVLPALHAMLNESPLDRYPAKRAPLPAFWKPSGWHRPVLHNGKALSDAAVDALGTMMTFPATEEVYAGLLQVKAACTPQSLADFAWDCFSAWLNASAPSKESWALTSLGVLGTDDTARKLTPFIRSWPGEAAHARAVTGLDVLAGIGSDVALMLLNGIAQKIKFKGLQDKAREKIEAIAEARGLSAEELEDRLAPDLGLDEQGSMVLDFGPRAFKVGFDESLKPYVREWQDGKAGARLTDLPKPKKTDDAALSSAAVERYKLLKKDARTIASQQLLRLELAMCARRRWSPEVFAQFIANHPLVRHLVRRLVWGVYAMPVDTSGEGEDAERRVASYGGTLQACFRVSEDGEYTTADDDPFVLPEGEQYKVGVPHALELSPEQGAAFGQLLADYELLQPFPQLGRDTYALSDEERALDKLLRWKDAKVATGKVMGLANIGWRRGPAQDGGSIWTYDKPANGGRTLELTFEPGIIVGLVDEFPEQTLGEVTLGRAMRSGWNRDGDLASFDTLDPIVASELIRDMERLRS